MIHLSEVSWHNKSWQVVLAGAIRDESRLARRLGLPSDAVASAGAFPLMVPEPFLAKMEPGNRRDPLLLQVLSRAQEQDSPAPGYSLDPLDESEANPVKGVLQKYRGRVLVIASGACAVNCRYCFRRHFPYQQYALDKDAWQRVFSYINEDASLSEVILSGGDPLTLKDDRLAWIAESLSEITHVKRLRIHTRVPVVIPQRICDEFVDWVASVRLQTVIVLHANHPNELDSFLQKRLQRLISAGATLLNQSVLLKHVNDDADILVELSTKLFSYGVLPYYLHMLDHVAGTAHFDVNDDTACSLMAEVRLRLPGYLVPQLVREVAGEGAKTRI